jgi:hypothetical protein
VTKGPAFVHDMTNMLGVVVGYANLLLSETPEGDPKRADIEEIRRAGEAALALLEKWNAAAPGEEVT